MLLQCAYSTWIWCHSCALKCPSFLCLLNVFHNVMWCRLAKSWLQKRSVFFPPPLYPFGRTHLVTPHDTEKWKKRSIWTKQYWTIRFHFQHDIRGYWRRFTKIVSTLSNASLHPHDRVSPLWLSLFLIFFSFSFVRFYPTFFGGGGAGWRLADTFSEAHEDRQCIFLNCCSGQLKTHSQMLWSKEKKC